MSAHRHRLIEREGGETAARKDESRVRSKEAAEKKNPACASERTVLKSLGLSGGIYGAVPCAVDVKDGKVVRIRPLHFDSKYDPKTFNAWKIEKNGKTFEPLMKAASGIERDQEG